MNLPDSGDRTEFSTGAVRDAAAGKGIPHNIPTIALRRLAIHFENGARKYGKSNFMKGMTLSSLFDSAFRHLLAAAEGDDTEDHKSAAIWNLAVWIWMEDQINKGNLPAELADLPYAKKP